MFRPRVADLFSMKFPLIRAAGLMVWRVIQQYVAVHFASGCGRPALPPCLTRLIEEGLQLRMRAQQVSAKRVRLPVYRGKGGLAPGLSGLSNKAMLDAADQDA